MRRQTGLLFVFAIVLAFGSYLFFRLFLGPGTPAYATEVAAALMGSLITVVITMLLLNRQSETELSKERNVKLLESRIKVYEDLVGRVEQVMLKGQVNLEDEIAVQMLNQRLSYFASAEVLEVFSEFARRFTTVAADGKVSDFERRELFDILGRLGVEIRYDLASEDDVRRERRRYSRERLEELVMSNVNSLSGKTTEDVFLEHCSEADRAYYSQLFAWLRSNGIEYWPGTKGFSISRYVRIYPSFGSRLTGLQVKLDQIPEARRGQVREFIRERAGVGGRAGPAAAAAESATTMSLSTSDLPLVDAQALLLMLTGESAKGGAAADGSADDSPE
jgi:hypothetical protein